MDSDRAVWCAGKIDRLCICSRRERSKPTKCRNSDFGLAAESGVRLLTPSSSLLRRGPHIHCPIALLACVLRPCAARGAAARADAQMFDASRCRPDLERPRSFAYGKHEWRSAVELGTASTRTDGPVSTTRQRALWSTYDQLKLNLAGLAARRVTLWSCWAPRVPRLQVSRGATELLVSYRTDPPTRQVRTKGRRLMCRIRRARGLLNCRSGGGSGMQRYAVGAPALN